MNDTATRRKQHTKRGPDAQSPLGRRPKFGAPVAQSSVHLKQEQRDWLRAHADERKAALGVDVSLSDVVRWAIDMYIRRVDADTVSRTHTITSALPESPATRSPQTHEQRAKVIKEGKLSKA